MIEIELKRIADALEKIANRPVIVQTPGAVVEASPPGPSTPAPTPAAAPAAEGKRGRGRPPKVETPPPAPEPTPEAAQAEDDWGDEPAAVTREDVLKALLAYKARLTAQKIKDGVEKKQAEADAHRETGALLTKAAGVATLTALPEAKYADVVKAATA